MAFTIFACSASAARVYVSQFEDASIAVIDTATDSVVDTIPVGDYPRDIAIDRTGTRGYVALGGNRSVAFLDLVHDTVIRTVAVGERVYEVALDVAGMRVYVLQGAPNVISVLDTSTGALLGTIPITGIVADYSVPQDLALNRSTGEIYALFDSSEIVVVDTHDDGVSGLLNSDEDLLPVALAVGPRGQELYVANWAYRSDFLPPQADIVTALDVSGHVDPTNISVGEQVGDVAVDPNSSRLFVATSSHVKIVDTSNHAVIASIPIQRGRHKLAFEPATNRIYVATNDTNPDVSQVTVIDAFSANVLRTIQVPGRAAEIAIAPAPSGTAVAQPVPTLTAKWFVLLAVCLSLLAIVRGSRRNARASAHR